MKEKCGKVVENVTSEGSMNFSEGLVKEKWRKSNGKVTSEGLVEIKWGFSEGERKVMETLLVKI